MRKMASGVGCRSDSGYGFAPGNRRVQEVVGFALLMLAAANAGMAAEGTTAVVAMPAKSSGGTAWQFLGPNRNGDYGTCGIAPAFPPGGPRELWRIPIGAGFACPVTDGERIFVTMLDGKSDVVCCLDGNSGKELWRKETGEGWVDKSNGGPRSTPAIRDGRLYVFSARGRLTCLDAADGKVVWNVDLPSRPPFWGLSGSPLLADGSLYVHTAAADGSLVAVDPSNGAIRWRAAADPAGYGSALAMATEGRQSILFITSCGAVAVAPTDGKEWYRIDWKTPYNVNFAAVPVDAERVLIASGYGTGSALVRIAGARNETVWRSRDLAPHFSTPVVRDGHIYGSHGQAGEAGSLVCVEVATGRTCWSHRAPEKGFGSAHLVVADNRLLVLGNEGTLLLVEPSPSAYRETGRARLLSGRTWTAPVLLGDRIVVRSEKELAAYRLGDRAAATSAKTAPCHTKWPFDTAEAAKRQQATGSELGLPVERALAITKDVSMSLRLIPAGEFAMGSPTDEVGRRVDEAVHRVRISHPFYIGVAEVTQDQWEGVMGGNPSTFKAAKKPVEQVNWDDCHKFLEKLSAKTGARCRLPTEAEWEYACRAGSAAPFGCGADHAAVACCSKQGEWASAGSTRECCSLAANAWGLHDMHGNVGEWCIDAEKPYAAGELASDPCERDPDGPTRVVRGGSWFLDPTFCRSAARAAFHRGYRDLVVGLRVVIETEATGECDKTER